MNRKLGFRIPGLCLLAALSLMAFATAGAQANGGDVYVNLQVLNTTVGIETLKATNATLLTTIGLSKLEIHCDAVLMHDGLLFSGGGEGGGGGSGEILLSTCETLLNLATSANCKPLEPIVSKVKSLALSHNGDTYTLFSPASGTVFTTLHLGALCPIGQNIEMSGSVVTECGKLAEGSWTHEDCNVEKIEQEVRQAPSALFSSHTLKVGTRAASLDGDVNFLLNGAHAFEKWGAEAL